MAVLYPRDDFARVFRVLVDDLGANPREIATTTDGPGLGLVISDDLFNRFLEAEGLPAENATSEPEPPRRRPGRPRKAQE